MQGRNSSEPSLFQMIDLEALVPPSHRLRKIDAVLDLSFVHEVVAECYAAGKGRPGIDPELALRMMLLGVLYDLSDRELCDEIAMHAGFRWFCRLNFHDPVPDHSTLSRLRNERWAESGVWERLRDEILRQCAEAGMISGRHLSLDGTQVEADASMKSFRPVGPRPADEDPEESGSGGRQVQEPQSKGAWRAHGQKLSNHTHRSITDADARLYRKGNSQGARLSYLVHDLIDTKSRVILRRRASHATNVAEREVGLELLDEVLSEVEDLCSTAPEILTADAGYGTSGFVADVLERGLTPHIPLQVGADVEPLPTWQRRPFTLGEARARRERLRHIEARNRTREACARLQGQSAPPDPQRTHLCRSQGTPRASAHAPPRSQKAGGPDGALGGGAEPEAAGELRRPPKERCGGRCGAGAGHTRRSPSRIPAALSHQNRLGVPRTPLRTNSGCDGGRAPELGSGAGPSSTAF